MNLGSNFPLSSRSSQTLAQCLPHCQLAEYSWHDRMDWNNAKQTTQMQQALNEGVYDGRTLALQEEGFRTFHTRVVDAHSLRPDTFGHESLLGPFGEACSETKEARIAHIITNSHLPKQDLHQEYSCFSSVLGRCCMGCCMGCRIAFSFSPLWQAI